MSEKVSSSFCTKEVAQVKYYVKYRFASEPSILWGEDTIGAYYGIFSS